MQCCEAMLLQRSLLTHEHGLACIAGSGQYRSPSAFQNLPLSSCHEFQPRRMHSARAAYSETRRATLSTLSAFAAWLFSAGILPQKALAREKGRGKIAPQVQPTVLAVPLHWEDGGFYLSFSLGGSDTKFLGVADTGSPFMLVAKCLRKDCASYCAEVGCFGGEGQQSDVPDTIEGYASGLVEIQWRRHGDIRFAGSTLTGEAVTLRNLQFGVQGKVTGFGGTGKAVFFGLIRDHMSDVKTTFLEQTPFRAISIDLRQPGRELLSLATAATGLWADNRWSGKAFPALPLVDPRRWGDPVKHYAAIAKKLVVGGETVLPASGAAGDGPRKILCIFDTGTTGACMTPSLFEAFNTLAQQGARAGLSFRKAKQLDVIFELSDGQELKFKMYAGQHPAYGLGLDLVTPIDEMAWAGSRETRPTSVPSKM